MVEGGNERSFEDVVSLPEKHRDPEYFFASCIPQCSSQRDTGTQDISSRSVSHRALPRETQGPRIFLRFLYHTEQKQDMPVGSFNRAS